MFRRRKFPHLHRELLLEPNRNVSRSKRFRNRWLNFFEKLFLLRHVVKLFRASFLLGGILSAMALFVLLALASPVFHLKKIAVIRDNPALDTAQIEASLKNFYGRNILFLRESEIQKKLMENFPEFREVDMNENWPSEIELTIVVSPPKFNLLNTETANFSVISEDGVILQSEPNEALPTVRVFQHPKPIKLRDQFLQKSDIEKIVEAENFLEHELDLSLNATHLLYAAHELHLISNGEMAIWMDLTLPIEPQLRKLEYAADKIGLRSKHFEHIDLRIPKQIFWKWR